jgi:flagellar hook-length control protein FliK
MELAPSLPTEVIGCTQRFDRVAPDPLQPAGGTGDASTAPPSFGELLQIIETLPVGETLPQAGKDLPAGAHSAPALAGNAPQSFALFTLQQPPAGIPGLAAEPAPAGAAAASAATSEASIGTAGSANVLDGRLGNAAQRGGDLLPAQIPPAIAAGGVSSTSTNPAGRPPLTAHDGGTAAAAPLRDFAPSNQSAELSARGATASIAAHLPGHTTEEAGGLRARANTRGGGRASIGSVGGLELPKIDSAAALARQVSAATLVPDAVAETASGSSATGSQLAAASFGATVLAGGDGSAAHSGSVNGTLVQTLGPSAPAQPSSGIGAAAAPGDVFGQGAGQALDTATPRWNEALAGRINWMVDHGIGEARIKLNPPELGALDVKISLLDDKTYVQLTSASASARDELSQTLPRLRDLLASSGLDLGGATVSDGREHSSSRGGPAETSKLPVEFATVADADSASARLTRRLTTQIDLYA